MVCTILHNMFQQLNTIKKGYVSGIAPKQQFRKRKQMMINIFLFFSFFHCLSILVELYRPVSWGSPSKRRTSKGSRRPLRPCLPRKPKFICSAAKTAVCGCPVLRLGLRLIGLRPNPWQRSSYNRLLSYEFGCSVFFLVLKHFMIQTWLWCNLHHRLTR